MAQVTDTHLIAAELGTGPYVDHVARLREVVRRINAEDPPVELVVLTGDLVDIGTEAENRLLCEVLAELRPPVVGVPGNHDRRETFPAALLSDRGTADGHLSWVLDGGEVRVVGLDSIDPGRPGGLLDDERVGWLERALAAGRDQPTVLALHHPPFDTGIEWMDRAGHPGPWLRPLLARHPQVQRVICGHLHRPIETRFEHAVVSVSPPTVHAVALDLARRPTPRLIVDPAGYQLHQYRSRDGLWVSHTRYVDTGHEPFVPEWA